MLVSHPERARAEGVCHGVATAQVENGRVAVEGLAAVHPQLQAEVAVEAAVRQVEARARQGAHIEMIRVALAAAEHQAVGPVLPPVALVAGQQGALFG